MISKVKQWPREAAYTLTAYLESKEPWVEFDPPSPFSARQLCRSQSTSLPEHVYSNLNRNGNGRPGPSGPGSSPDLDAEHSPSPLTVLELGSGTGIIIAKLAEVIDRGVGDSSAGWFLSLSMFEGMVRVLIR